MGHVAMRHEAANPGNSGTPRFSSSSLLSAQPMEVELSLLTKL